MLRFFNLHLQQTAQRKVDAETTIPIATPSPAYFERLDAIRAVAILWVFVFHFCGACWGLQSHEWLAKFDGSSAWVVWPWRIFAQFCRMGAQGVPIFFVLSGFLIHYTFCRGGSQSVGQFWLRRFGRIYPPYFVALVIFALVLGQMWRERGRVNFLHHALLIHNFRDDFYHGINGSFWSLAVEAQYYLLYPLLLSIRRAIGMHAVLGTSLAVKLAIPLLTSAGVIPSTGDATVCLAMPERYFEWILGMYVADRLLEGRPAFGLPPVAGWLSFVGAAAAYRYGWTTLAVVPLISLGTAIWIDRVVRVPAQPWRIEKLLFPIGVVSYSLYLWHQPIIGEVVNRIVRNQNALRTLEEPALMAVALFVAAGASALVAAGSYRLTEVPSMELTKQLAKRLAGRAREEQAPAPRKLAA